MLCGFGGVFILAVLDLVPEMKTQELIGGEDPG